MPAIELLLLQKPPQCNRYARPRTGPFVLWHSGQLASGVPQAKEEEDADDADGTITIARKSDYRSE